MSARFLVRSHMRQMVAYLLWSCSLVAGPRSLAHGYAPCAAAACDAQLGRMIFGQTKNLTARSSRPRAHQLNLDLHNPFSRKNLWCVCVCVCVCVIVLFSGPTLLLPRTTCPTTTTARPRLPRRTRRRATRQTRWPAASAPRSRRRFTDSRRPRGREQLLPRNNNPDGYRSHLEELLRLALPPDSKGSSQGWRRSRLSYRRTTSSSRSLRSTSTAVPPRRHRSSSNRITARTFRWGRTPPQRDLFQERMQLCNCRLFRKQQNLPPPRRDRRRSRRPPRRRPRPALPAVARLLPRTAGGTSFRRRLAPRERRRRQDVLRVLSTSTNVGWLVPATPTRTPGVRCRGSML